MDNSSATRSKYKDSVEYNDDDAFAMECEELIDYFKQRTVDSLIRCTKQSLDQIKRRFDISFNLLELCKQSDKVTLAIDAKQFVVGPKWLGSSNRSRRTNKLALWVQSLV